MRARTGCASENPANIGYRAICKQLASVGAAYFFISLLLIAAALRARLYVSKRQFVTGKAIGTRGWSGSINIPETSELMAFLRGLAPSVTDAAYEALCDLSGTGHRAYDEHLHRAYCFERDGLSFHYHWWNDIPDAQIAAKLFETSRQTRLPFEVEYSEQIYRAALAVSPPP